MGEEAKIPYTMETCDRPPHSYPPPSALRPRHPTNTRRTQKAARTRQDSLRSKATQGSRSSASLRCQGSYKVEAGFGGAHPRLSEVPELEPGRDPRRTAHEPSPELLQPVTPVQNASSVFQHQAASGASKRLGNGTRSTPSLSRAYSNPPDKKGITTPRASLL